MATLAIFRPYRDLRRFYQQEAHQRVISDPQLDVQLREQSFKPARLSTGFHSYSHLHSLGREIAIQLFRFLTVLQSPLLKLPSVGIHKRNLLKARVVVCSYNDHIRLQARVKVVALNPTTG
jgi:hypothetical protein